jgi:hypothetical protein
MTEKEFTHLWEQVKKRPDLGELLPLIMVKYNNPSIVIENNIINTKEGIRKAGEILHELNKGLKDE